MRAQLLALFLLIAVVSATNQGDLVDQLDGVVDVANPSKLVDQVKAVDNPKLSVLEGLGLAETAIGADSSELGITPPKIGSDPTFDEWVDQTSGTSISSGSHSVTVNDVDGSISIAIPIQIPNGAAGLRFPFLAF